MLHKTRGIVINYTKFKESSIIVRLFTEAFGLQSYLVNSVRSTKSKNKIALFQALTLLDLEVYKNDKKDIQRIAEFRCLYPYRNIPFDPKKSTIALFISEVISKTVSNEEQQTELFEFFQDSLICFDKDITQNSSNFHLFFLYHLCFQLGHYANAKEIMLQIGTWLPYSNEEREVAESCLTKIQHLHFSENIVLTNLERKLTLGALITFCQHNISSLQNLRSLEVLKTLYL